MEKDVNVCIGHDSIMDPWYSMGKGNMLAAANLLAHTAHMNGHNQLLQLIDMITHRSAKTMAVENSYGITEGNQADMIILDARSEAEALRLTSECLYVIRKGNIICETTPAKRMLQKGGTTEIIDFKLNFGGEHNV